MTSHAITLLVGNLEKPANSFKLRRENNLSDFFP